MSQSHFYIGGWSKTNRSIRTGVFGVDNPVENLKQSITTENVKSGVKVDIERYRFDALLGKWSRSSRLINYTATVPRNGYHTLYCVQLLPA
jgi:hypothetical protein